MIGSNNIDLKELNIHGTDVNYYFICKRKLWLFSHGISMEKNSDRVDYANLIHDESYKNQSKREYNIDNLICIDMVDTKDIIHEIKMSTACEKASIYQLLYYLYILKQKGIIKTGEINYPLLRKTEKVELTDELESELINIMQNIKDIKSSNICPDIEADMKFCKKCSYLDFCYG